MSWAERPRPCSTFELRVFIQRLVRPHKIIAGAFPGAVAERSVDPHRRGSHTSASAEAWWGGELLMRELPSAGFFALAPRGLV